MTMIVIDTAGQEDWPKRTDDHITALAADQARAGATTFVEEDWVREGGKFVGYQGEKATADDKALEAAQAQFMADFERAFAGSPYSAHVTHHTADEMRAEGMVPVTTNDGQTGVLVWDHGDGRVEATALYNVSDVPGAGVAILQDAIDNHGVNYVEAFGPYLPELYATLGFADDEVFDFDPEQAPDNWNSERFDEPDYHTMRLAA